VNRHERRKAAKVFELEMIPANQIGGMMCAWRGCEAVVKYDDLRNGDLPGGWSALLLTRSLRHYANLLDIPPSDCLRDACLCPKHTQLLDSLLVDLGRELDGPVAGTA
jgi:hypothetical protein